MRCCLLYTSRAPERRIRAAFTAVRKMLKMKMNNTKQRIQRKNRKTKKQEKLGFL